MSPARRRARPESGFLLIGVIMFVLALTILGISLYSLSSYEAEFQGNSRDSNEAFYLGQGGTEMVLKLLQLRWNLDDAQLAVTHEGVDSVYVSQPKPGGGFLTAGAMNDSVLTVTVVTSVHGNTRRMVGKYRPTRTTSYYTRLFTVGDGGMGAEFNVIPPGSSMQTYALLDADTVRTWTNDLDPGAANTAWGQYLDWQQPRAMRFGGVPPPDVPGFRAAHSGGFVQPSYNLLSMATFKFDKGAGSEPVYYEAQGLLPLLGFTVCSTLYGFDLVVGGTAIWVLPDGLKAFQKVNIRSAGGIATLVIVGSPNPARPQDPEAGLYFYGGLDVAPEVNVILVSDGAIYLMQENDYQLPFEARHLSIYCNTLFLEGPHDPHQTELSYDTRMTPVIQALEQSGDLPRGTAAPRSSFAFVSGSWRDVTP